MPLVEKWDGLISGETLPGFAAHQRHPAVLVIDLQPFTSLCSELLVM